MASGQESGGMTLMDLITSDPTSASSNPPSGAPPPASTLGKPPPSEKKSKKVSLMQIQSDTMAAAKALNPVRTNIIQRQKKKPVSYSQLARSIHELAATSDQKSSQKQLVHHVFPKLAVYNSVDPSLAPSLLMLHQQCEDRNVLRYVYYYLARILSDNGSQGLSAGGGIPTPNWDALADIDAVGGVTRADVVPRIVEKLTSLASNADVEVHAQRLAALKALTFAPSSNSEILAKLYEIVFGILEKVADTKQKRKKGMFGRQGGDKESVIRSNLQYAALSALRRLPLDPGNPAFLHRAIQGVSFSDPVAVRHALAMISELATRDPYSVAMALGCSFQFTVAKSRIKCYMKQTNTLYTFDTVERPDIKAQFNAVLYQLLLDPSDRVCFEAIFCVLGKFDNTERTEERAAGWVRLTREILKLPDAPSVSKGTNVQSKEGLPPKANDKPASKSRRPQSLIKLVIRRLESSFRSFSRPVLHAAARVVQEMGKSRAAAYALGVYDIDEGAQIYGQSENVESNDLDQNDNVQSEAWPSALLNDILLTLHARFKTCLVGAGPGGKHTALEAVTIVLDLPPPQPGAMYGLTSVDRVSASDPKAALALQRLVQAAVWFLGENANYAATEYAWESATPPGTALMMLDADKMVAAASSRNPTLAGALTRLQRCAFSGSWEVRIVAVQALTTMAIRSGEPFRLQIYEFLHALAQGGVQSQFADMKLSNGEDQGASGTGLGSLISPMLRVLDEMYKAQDELIKDMRNHDNNKQEWTDEELKKLYETHEKLLDLVSLFCYVPRAKYLPLGPTSTMLYLSRKLWNSFLSKYFNVLLLDFTIICVKLIDIYRTRHNISASTGLNDPAVATGISDLVYELKTTTQEESDGIDPDLANAWAAGLEDGLWGNNAPAMERVNEFLAGAGTDAPEVEEENITSRPSVSYDDMWAKTLLETSEQDEDDARSSGTSSPESTGSVETSISSHFGGMSYPSLFSSRPSGYGASQQAETKQTGAASRFGSTSTGGPSSSFEGVGSPIKEEPPSYSAATMQRFESFQNPLAGGVSQDEEASSENPQFGKALYDFTAGGDDELNLTAGEEVQIDYEVDGWYYVKKKRPGRDGKMAGLVPVLYVSSS
ncbi:hypothetical protein QJS04_geneDACA007602 [Acorus gramineus]|uniref:SH3 domain-containing protein n=1 Tax=Acorus gramineus TaxID=55184 RepID=A0AAV9B7A2_ACOGR|nr:hypothetical protein QJS04_geneDACA007602 [Acorus gramineus]